MHGQTAAVAADLPHYGKAVLPGVVINIVSDVAQMAPGLQMGDGQLHRFLRHPHQLLRHGRQGAEGKHPGGVAVIAVYDGGAVHIDDVPCPEDHLVAGDAVADLVVHRGADAFREALVVQRRRDAAQPAGRAVYDVVDVLGGHAHLKALGHLIQDLRIDRAGPADALDLLCVFQHILPGDADAFGVEGRKPLHHLLMALSIGQAAAAEAKLLCFHNKDPLSEAPAAPAPRFFLKTV